MSGQGGRWIEIAPIQRRLRDEMAVPFEGMWLRCEGEWPDLAPGDSYVAERNNGPKLLTVARVAESLGDRQQWAGCVFPVEHAYPYDLGECVKVSIHESDPRGGTAASPDSSAALGATGASGAISEAHSGVTS